MREIKFRAWNKEYEAFKNQSNIIIRGDGHIFDRETEEELHGLELMQYTGLKDKNGKEIYEGDILMGADSNGITGDIPDEVFWEDTRGQWMIRNSENPDDTLWEINRDGMEIIGNIYENKELLKS